MGQYDAYVKAYQKTAKGKYIRHRTNAIRRGIDWQFTFETWWQVWQESGKWEERGVGAGKYCMARYDDYGPYSPENVKIISMVENTKEMKKDRKQFMKMEDWDTNAWRKRNSPFDILKEISIPFSEPRKRP